MKRLAFFFLLLFTLPAVAQNDWQEALREWLTAEDMEDLVVFIANAGIPQILLIAPPKISFTPQSFQMSYVYGDSSYAPLYCEQGEKLTEYYRELAAKRGLRFADASSWDLDFAFDGVHLSEKGHVAFADEMEKVMRAIAERG